MWANQQTMRETYTRITQGERPWNALGDFLNYWNVYAIKQREELVRDSIVIQEMTQDSSQWAAYCASLVEYLCLRDSIPCPSWVRDSTYTLEAAWYTGLGASKPLIQMRLREETPEPFKRRNVYCRAHAFSTKYSTAETVQQHQTA